MNRPTSKYYKRSRRVKWSNPIVVWLLVFLTIMIMVPIQAAEEPAEPETVEVQQVEETEATEPADFDNE